MSGLLQGLGQNVVILTVGGTVIVTFILMTISNIAAVRAKERTRRELAAYIAEGAMTTDEAERILTAGGEADAGCCGGKKRLKSGDAPCAVA